MSARSDRQTQLLGEIGVGRSKRQKVESIKQQSGADVFHHRLSLERENELLIQENIRLTAKIKAAQDRIAELERERETI